MLYLAYVIFEIFFSEKNKIIAGGIREDKFHVPVVKETIWLRTAMPI